jgi:exopolysaccharide production protein ExoZ
LTAAGYLSKPTDLRLAFVTNALLLEFLLGIVICQIYLQAKKIPLFVSIGLLTTGIAWYISMVFYNYGDIWDITPLLKGATSMKRFLLWGIPSGCLAAGCIFLEKIGKFDRLWNNKACRLIGDASYSIYLVHLTVYLLFGLLYRQTSFFIPAELSIFVQLIVALAISTTFYWWVERPLLKWLQKSPRKTTLLGASPSSPAQIQST